MSGTHPDTVSCNEVRQALEKKRALTAWESAHMESCEACLEAWLDATVTQALDAKPEVSVPADFAARIAMNLPEKRSAAHRSQEITPHWGLLTSIVLVAVGMVTMAVADPVNVHSWTGVIFVTLVVTEIAGIALWLGTGHSGEGRT